jgi:hypothetical protein
MGGSSWGYGDGSGSGEYNPQGRVLVAEAWGSTAADMQPSAARVHLGEGWSTSMYAAHMATSSISYFLGGGGRLLQVDTFTAERYSPHWMNWVDTPARRPAARPANKTSPQKHTHQNGTATHQV